MCKELHKDRFLYLLAPKSLVSLALHYIHLNIQPRPTEWHQILTQIKLHQPNCLHWGLSRSVTSQVHWCFWTKQHRGNVYWPLLHINIALFLHQILVSCHCFLTFFSVIFLSFFLSAPLPLEEKPLHFLFISCTSASTLHAPAPSTPWWQEATASVSTYENEKFHLSL